MVLLGGVSTIMVLVGVGRGVQLKCSRHLYFFCPEHLFFGPQNKKNPRQMNNKQEPKFRQDENWLPPSSQISDLYPAALVDEFKNCQPSDHLQSNCTWCDNTNCWCFCNSSSVHVQQQRKNDTCNDNDNDKIATLACPAGLPPRVLKVPDCTPP